MLNVYRTVARVLTSAGPGQWPSGAVAESDPTLRRSSAQPDRVRWHSRPRRRRSRAAARRAARRAGRAARWSAISYRGIKAGHRRPLVAAPTPAAWAARRAQRRVGLVKFFTRYAILAVAGVRDNGAFAPAPGGRACGRVVAGRGGRRSKPCAESPMLAKALGELSATARIMEKLEHPTLDRPGRECCASARWWRALLRRARLPVAPSRDVIPELPRDGGADRGRSGRSSA